MGAAGDMLSAALLDLLDDTDDILKKINSLIPGVTVTQQRTEKCGIQGNHVSVVIGGEEEVSEDVHIESAAEEIPQAHVHDDGHSHVHIHLHDTGPAKSHDHEHDLEHEHDHEHSHEHTHDHSNEDGHTHDHGHSHEHSHSGYADILGLIDGLDVSDTVKENAKAVYGRIAQAEAAAHGAEVSQIHFHEVGTKDAVIDVTLFCMLMDVIRPEKVVVSPIHVGSGNVRCAHGILPVPTPATAYLLRGVPSYSGSIRGELCTPTGAALLTQFASEFGQMPVMRTDRIGYGMGNKDFPVANCVRAFLGETEGSTGEMYEISFNVDDMTAENIAFAQEQIFAAGATEVFVTSVYMKKNRPGTLFTVIAREDARQDVVRAIFRHTSTIGMREVKCGRYTLDREIIKEDTPLGEIRKKRSSGYGVVREKYEYDDLSRIARERGISISEVLEKLN